MCRLHTPMCVTEAKAMAASGAPAVFLNENRLGTVTDFVDG